MRAALGASRGRIARELLSETVLLGLAAGALGLAFTQAALGLLRRIAPARLPRVDEIGIDPAGAALHTGDLADGRSPVRPASCLEIWRPGRRRRSKRAADRQVMRPARLRTRNALVVAEIALAMMLLIVSGSDDSNVRGHAAGPSRIHAGPRRCRHSRLRYRRTRP